MRATSVQCTAAARTEPDGCHVERSDEPEEHVDQVDPNRVLHADLTTLLGSRVGWDVDLAEDAEERCPQDAARPKSASQGYQSASM